VKGGDGHNEVSVQALRVSASLHPSTCTSSQMEGLMQSQREHTFGESGSWKCFCVVMCWKIPKISSSGGLKVSRFSSEIGKNVSIND
jgi:hypothetical protein